MQDERNTPQDEDREEVEAHHLQRDPAEDPGRSAGEEDDEVEAHHLQRDPAEHLQRDSSE